MNLSISFFPILANPLPMPYKKNRKKHRRLPSQTIDRIFRSKIRTTLSKIAQ
ncbi:hypothetical protein HanXRQr2_Chr05g0230471 [Helianthus annuus]|uniref:Uncharacterized protein n=1 Tax=Helianthus annuus TaxID=4232 RepID=A0A251USF4_HELAN|nr:hypothetical protein HanXRQr2_Chr05g0230471 [Helianthus annuus]KAJ0923924.1 hypothetical protein HanPSC8_Chr05g0222311 [Helianthus annuus]